MEEVIIRKNGDVGHITLNRPYALNALTHGMISRIETALLDWRSDKNIKLVLVDAEGSKAFCSGGDISHLDSDKKFVR